MEVVMDNMGQKWKIIGGDISYGDWAYNWDTGDVIGIDENDDLYLRNDTCTKVDPLDETNDWF